MCCLRFTFLNMFLSKKCYYYSVFENVPLYISYEILYHFITTIVLDGEFKGFKFEKKLEKDRKFTKGNMFVFYKIYKTHFYDLMCEKGMRKEAVFILNEMNKKIKKTFDFHNKNYNKEMIETMLIGKIKEERNYRLKFYKTRKTITKKERIECDHIGPIVKKEKDKNRTDRHMIKILVSKTKISKKLRNMSIYEFRRIHFLVEERISKGHLEKLSLKTKKIFENGIRDVIYDVLIN